MHKVLAVYVQNPNKVHGMDFLQLQRPSNLLGAVLGFAKVPRNISMTKHQYIVRNHSAPR